MYVLKMLVFFFFFFKQKTAYEIVSRDWSSDVCSSDLICHTKIPFLRNGINGETVHSHRTVCSNTQIYIIVTMPNMHYVSLLWDFKNKFSVYSMVKDLSKKPFNPRTEQVFACCDIQLEEIRYC